MPNTLHTIAYTFAAWTLLSIVLGAIIGTIMYRMGDKQ